MRRTSHRPAGHPWYPILFGSARIRRGWVSLPRIKRKAIWKERRRVGRRMDPQRSDPLVLDEDIGDEHPSRHRLHKRCSVATGPGRLP